MKKIIAFFTEIGSDINDRHVTVHAAAADYFFFMSLVPILMLLVSLIRYLPFTEADVLALLAGALPSSVYEVISSIVSGIYRDGGAALTVSIVLTLWSASSAMRAVMKGLDAVYGVTRKENVILFFARALLYMLLFVIVIVLSFVVLVYGREIMRIFHARLPDNRLVQFLFGFTRYAHFLVVLVLLTAVFWLMYKWVPAGRHRAAHQLPGALFTAASWVIFSWAFSLYVSVSDKWGAYGYIGTVMVAMMWMYYCLQFLLIGGCLNAYIERHRK